MKQYQVAIILTIEAKDYTEALEVAKEIVEDTRDKALNSVWEQMNVVLDYEKDNENQRVLYLPPVL